MKISDDNWDFDEWFQGLIGDFMQYMNEKKKEEERKVDRIVRENGRDTLYLNLEE